MNPLFFDRIRELYEYTDSFMPHFDGNPCETCNICCGSINNLGVSALEFDYIEESLRRSSKDLASLSEFKKFVEGLHTDRYLQVCPCFSPELKGCTIHRIRPLSCRTFACFIGEGMEDLIPELCLLKKDVVKYNAATFFEKMPFVVAFYKLIAEYDNFLKP